jgi:hypothetical protein
MWLDVETWLPLLIVGLTVAIYFVAEVENVRVSRVTARSQAKPSIAPSNLRLARFAFGTKTVPVNYIASSDRQLGVQTPPPFPAPSWPKHSEHWAALNTRPLFFARLTQK